MPTDPKFKTVSKISKQPITSVISVYLFLLVDASSNSTERGVTLCNSENVASALDLETDQVDTIKQAMEGRLLDGNRLKGWKKRQPKREDDSAERVREWRLSRDLKKNVTQCNETVTQCNAPDTDTEEEIKKEKQEKEKKASPLSGKPDDVIVFSDQKAKRLREKAQRREEAIQVLNFLNEKVGKSYRPVEANLKLIEARLVSGVSVQQCRSVIARKRRQWLFNEDMEKYLRPATLFNRTKFEQYLGELEVITDEEEDHVR